jgi:hypothetical protein
LIGWQNHDQHSPVRAGKAIGHGEYVVSPTGEITLNSEEIARMTKALEAR